MITPDDPIDCPTCGREQTEGEASIGALGRYEYFKCRGCGWGWERLARDNNGRPIDDAP
jgi:hypothetical protein